MIRLRQTHEAALMPCPKHTVVQCDVVQDCEDGLVRCPLNPDEGDSIFDVDERPADD